MIASGLNLSAACLDRLSQLLERHAPDLKVWAYGSRLGQESHEGSDLDLVLIAPQGRRVPATQLLELREALRESDLPILVDVHDWARLPVAFQNEISHRHHVLRF